MNERDARPDPDVLLGHIQPQENQRTRGKLKIFLGYVAGVGKTYAMLEAAQQRREEKVDVVAAYIETHGRAETEARLKGLESIPPRQVDYRGVTLSEMNLDAVLARHPALALVDELAHTNAPGSRHTRRYQDVEELLAIGIDVYTTLNVQHLESLNDVVAQITGTIVRETIPDWVIDQANELEVIDLPPEELQQRLREGKVYVSQQAARAIEKFFRQGNLTALREIALRRAAERVGDQMRAYMEVHAIPGPWHAEERILVCLSPSVLAERLVRAGRRLADEINADWEAIYVETSRHAQLSEDARDQVARALRLAEELGAKTARLSGTSVADMIGQYAHTHNITKIIAGKPVRPRWVDLAFGSVADGIVRRSGDIDVYLISAEAPAPSMFGNPLFRLHSPWHGYLLSLAAVIICTLAGQLIDPFLPITNLVMVYLLGIVLVAVRAGRGPAVVASALSVFAFNYFFVPPRYTFLVNDTHYVLTFAILLIVGLVIGTLGAQVREQAQTAQRTQTRTAALYDLSRELAGTAMLDHILDTIVAFVGQTFGHGVALYVSRDGKLALGASSPNVKPGSDELAVASWVFGHGQSAGRGTDTLSAACASYFPLKTAQTSVGVLGVVFQDAHDRLSPEQRRFLEAAASLSALAIERAELADKARQMQLMKETEKLQTALLNSISHDLRTPLASITGSLSSLDQDASFLDEAARHDLLTTALEQAERLNRLVGNLLDMTRLESGAVTVVKTPGDVQELVGVALQEMGSRAEARQIVLNIPPDLPPVPMDLVLMARVLVNVLDNAIKYSEPGTAIEIACRQLGSLVEIEIADQGIGIPQADLSHVFDKFYHVQRSDNVTGTGLGLSISKGFVEAHGGRIWAKDRPGGIGAVVTIALPLTGSPVTALEASV
jgi:two-component system sensor histidine kinase KdpD